MEWSDVKCWDKNKFICKKTNQKTNYKPLYDDEVKTLNMQTANQISMHDKQQSTLNVNNNNANIDKQQSTLNVNNNNANITNINRDNTNNENIQKTTNVNNVLTDSKAVINELRPTVSSADAMSRLTSDQSPATYYPTPITFNTGIDANKQISIMQSLVNQSFISDVHRGGNGGPSPEKQYSVQIGSNDSPVVSSNIIAAIDPPAANIVNFFGKQVNESNQYQLNPENKMLHALNETMQQREILMQKLPQNMATSQQVYDGSNQILLPTAVKPQPKDGLLDHTDVTGNLEMHGPSTEQSSDMDGGIHSNLNINLNSLSAHHGLGVTEKQFQNPEDLLSSNPHFKLAKQIAESLAPNIVKDYAVKFLPDISLVRRICGASCGEAASKMEFGNPSELGEVCGRSCAKSLLAMSPSQFLVILQKNKLLDEETEKQRYDKARNTAIATIQPSLQPNVVNPDLPHTSETAMYPPGVSEADMHHPHVNGADINYPHVNEATVDPSHVSETGMSHPHESEASMPVALKPEEQPSENKPLLNEQEQQALENALKKLSHLKNPVNYMYGPLIVGDTHFYHPAIPVGHVDTETAHPAFPGMYNENGHVFPDMHGGNDHDMPSIHDGNNPVLPSIYNNTDNDSANMHDVNDHTSTMHAPPEMNNGLPQAYAGAYPPEYGHGNNWHGAYGNSHSFPNPEEHDTNVVEPSEHDTHGSLSPEQNSESTIQPQATSPESHVDQDHTPSLPQGVVDNHVVVGPPSLPLISGTPVQADPGSVPLIPQINPATHGMLYAGGGALNEPLNAYKGLRGDHDDMAKYPQPANGFTGNEYGTREMHDISSDDQSHDRLENSAHNMNYDRDWNGESRSKPSVGQDGIQINPNGVDSTAPSVKEMEKGISEFIKDNIKKNIKIEMKDRNQGDAETTIKEQKEMDVTDKRDKSKHKKNGNPKEDFPSEELLKYKRKKLDWLKTKIKQYRSYLHSLVDSESNGNEKVGDWFGDKDENWDQVEESIVKKFEQKDGSDIIADGVKNLVKPDDDILPTGTTGFEQFIKMQGLQFKCQGH